MKTPDVIDVDSASFGDVLRLMEEPPLDSRALYYRWEREQWEASVLDLARDAADWAALEVDVKTALSSAMSSIFPPEEHLGDLLVPFVDAVESEEDQVFLTSQLVDQARAVVFGGRLRTETGIALETQETLNELFDAIRLRADAVRAEREQNEPLYEGLLLHNIVFEGVLASTLIQVVGEYLDRTSMLPGLRAGLINYARDITRHVQFGVGILGRGVTRDRGSYAGALGEVMENAVTFVRSSPATSDDVLAPLSEDQMVSGIALETFARRMHDIGLDMPT